MLSIHQLGDAARVCDRLVLLSAGRVVGEGTLDDLRIRAGKPHGSLEDIFLALT
jgi:ABC-2 type transport system ATP-binding protein